VYDASKGRYTDLGVLDVQQIFGRAGRPQFDTQGDATIVTSHDKLALYLGMLTRSTAIESQFLRSLTDNLNAGARVGADMTGGAGPTDCKRRCCRRATESGADQAPLQTSHTLDANFRTHTRCRLARACPVRPSHPAFALQRWCWER